MLYINVVWNFLLFDLLCFIYVFNLLYLLNYFYSIVKLFSSFFFKENVYYYIYFKN